MVVNVDRIKGAGASTEVRIRIEQVEIEGLDDFKRPRTGAVLVSINSPAVSSVLAFPIALSSRESGLLTAMGDHPGASFKELAEKVEWGEPDKPTSSQIRNVMTRLERRGLVRKGENKHYFLTKEGAALPRELQVRQPGLS